MKPSTGAAVRNHRNAVRLAVELLYALHRIPHRRGHDEPSHHDALEPEDRISGPCRSHVAWNRRYPLGIFEKPWDRVAVRLQHDQSEYRAKSLIFLVAEEGKPT